MAVNSSQINVTDLDFDNISDNLKNYLKGQIMREVIMSLSLQLLTHQQLILISLHIIMKN